MTVYGLGQYSCLAEGDKIPLYAPDLGKMFTEPIFIVCRHVNVGQASENLGDAKDKASIVAENQRKQLSQLPQGKIKRLEAIVYPVAGSHGYPFHDATAHKPLSKSTLHLIRLHDGFSIAYFHAQEGKEKSLIEGLVYFLRSHKRSSWR